MNKDGFWSLDLLYSGLDSPEFQADQERHSRLVQDLLDAASKQGAKVFPPEDIHRLLPHIQDLNALQERLFCYAQLRLTVNTQDQEASKRLLALRHEAAELSNFYVLWNRSLAEASQELLADPRCQDFRFYIEEAAKGAQHLMPAAEEALYAQLQLSGSTAWEQLFDQLVSGLRVEMEGQYYGLSEVRNLANSTEAPVRKKAYEAEVAAYPQIETSVAAALSAIKQEVQVVSQKRNFADPLDEAAFKSRMSRETLEVLLSSMREGLPILRRYFMAKARYLGYKQGLPWYEIFAPLEGFDAHYSIEEARDLLLRHFEKLWSPIAELIRRAFDEDWMDLYPRANKVGGAFCMNLPTLGQSRVLSNFDGSFSAVSTLAHELGHAYHGQRIEASHPLCRSYSMPVAETASNFNETHLMLGLYNEAQDAQARLALLEFFLSNVAQSVMDIYSRFCFEKAVFARCKTGSVDAASCKELMAEAQETAYGEALDPAFRHPYMWACKGHYYSARLSYYNYPYAFGSLFALGLYKMFQDRGQDFMPDYDRLLTLTGNSSVEDSAASLGIDLSQGEFWKQALSLVDQLCQDFEKLVDELRPES